MVKKQQVLDCLKEVIDPELNINIVDLGLVYKVSVDKQGKVRIRMTLTTPGCPLAGVFEELVEESVRKLKGVKGIEIEIIFDPPWTQEMMSDEARAELGLD